MAVKITFATVDKTAFLDLDGQNTFTRQQNERGQASIVLLPGYVPTQYDRVIMYDNDGVTPVFDGFVLTAASQSFEQGSTQHKTVVQCADAMAFLDWCFWSADYTVATTLKTILTGVVAGPLNAYGITLDAAQDNGDTFQPFSVGQGGIGVKVSDFLRQLGTACNPPRVIQMSATRAIRMLVPGTSAAPFSISNLTPNCLDFNWAHSSFTPANKVTLVCGPTGPGTPTQSWVVGAPSTWEVDIQCIPGGWNEGGVWENGTVFRTLSAPGSGGYYEFSPTTGKGTISVGSGSKAANGTKLTFKYTAIYPFIVTATSGATPVIEAQYTDPDQLLLAPGQLEVNGLLAQLNQSPREATIITTTSGLAPSQSLSVTLAIRDISAATFTITSVSALLTEFRNTAGKLWVYTAQATESTVYQGSYLDQMRQMIGGGSGSTPVAVAASGDVNYGVDVIAHPGGITAPGDYESALSVFSNSGGSGPALRLGRTDRAYAYVVFTDVGFGLARLRFHPIVYGSTIGAAMDLTEGVTAGHFYLLPGTNALLFLGDYDGNTGIGAPNNIIEGIKAANAMFTQGVFERSRTARMGDRTTVAFAAGNFAADNGSNWTLASGDQDTYAWMMVGRAILVAFELKTTTVANTPGYLTIDIPGAHTVDVQVRNALGYFTDNGVNSNGMAVVVPGESVIRIYRRDVTALTNATDNTDVRGEILFWCAEN